MPVASQPEMLAVQSEMAGVTSEQLTALKNLRFWVIGLTDPVALGKLTEEQRTFLRDNPERAIDTLHSVYTTRLGVDPLTVVRADPRVLRSAAQRASSPDEAARNVNAAALIDEAHAILDRRVQGVGRKLLEAAGRTDVSIVLEPAVGENASVPVRFGSREIYVGPEMVLAAATDGQLACVIGHELGHLEGGHTTSGAWANVGKGALTVLATAAAAGALAYAKQGQPLNADELSAAQDLGALTRFVVADVPLRLSGWERDQEREADLLGAGFMERAGFAVSECADFMRLMVRREALSGSPDVPAWWLVHPPSAERAVVMSKLAGQPIASASPPADVPGAPPDDCLFSKDGVLITCRKGTWPTRLESSPGAEPR